MNRYLIFRTDRVGDFLLSLSLIKIIKINYPDSKITVVASERNVEYIKTFDVVNNVIILKNNFLSKLKLIFNLRKKKYESIIVHDGKNRSRFVSCFLKYKKRVVCITDLIDTQLDIIQKACIKMQINFRSMIERMRQRYNTRCTTNELSKLTDREIADIGIHRSNIKSHAYEVFKNEKPEEDPLTELHNQYVKAGY
mgnify:CR=1 FL=1